jgi:DNA-binding beta-propeller fold protein YncE
VEVSSVVGRSEYRYAPDPNWAQLPAGLVLDDLPGVAVDSADRVFVFTRGPLPVLVFDRHGTYLDAWGAGEFIGTHGIYVAPDDTVYCVDHRGHRIKRFTSEGALIQEIAGESPAETGYVWGKPETVARAAPPFCFPTNIYHSPDGDLLVADGYGNARVHRFSPDGTLIASWGAPGSGPGEFRTPHGILVDPDGTIYVGETGNSRVQVFDLDGTWKAEWTDVQRGSHLCLDGSGSIYVAEAGHVWRGWPGPMQADPAAARARITVRDRSGRLLGEFGKDDIFFSPHGMAVDSRGDVYVAEVPRSACGGAAPQDYVPLTKYVRL